MPLLASFAYTGQFCLGGGGSSCLATGIIGTGGATVDWCDWIPIQVGQTGPSLPIRLVTRSDGTVIFANPNNTGINGEVFAIYLHSIIR